MKSFRTFLREQDEATIYCDLDGVLVDFLSRASEVLGRKLVGRSVKLDADDWKKITATPDFWSKLSPHKSGMKLWKYIKKYQPRILSALPVTGQQWAAQGKRLWVKRNLPSVSSDRLLLVLRSEKQRYAKTVTGKPNILIDDHAKNIREWEAAGGVGILHHHTTANQTIAKLKKLGFKS